MERSKDWFKQAQRDLEKVQIDINHSYYEWACFTAQQAAEKAVKALYQKANSHFHGHSLLQMLKGLSEKTEVSEELYHSARVLDRYYTETRYPNGFPEGSPAEYFDEKIAEEALHASRKIIRFCEDNLG